MKHSPDSIAESKPQSQHNTDNGTHNSRMHKRNRQLKHKEHKAEIRQNDPANETQDAFKDEVGKSLIGFEVEKKIRQC